MRRIIAVTVAFAMSLTALPTFASARAGRVARQVTQQGTQQCGSISGTAQDASRRPIAQTTVQLRNLDSGQLVGTTQSATNGAFSFDNLAAGKYAIEIVDASGKILGTSAAVTVAGCSPVAGVIVSTSAAAVLGAAGAAAAGVAAAGGFSTAVVITTLAVAGGVAGAVAIAKHNASPSR